MTMNFLRYVTEGADGKELVQERLPYQMQDLEPVISEQTTKYHYSVLGKGYVDRYNRGEGDANFNYSGAVLHNLFFRSLTPPRAANRPTGASSDLIDSVYGGFNQFRQEFEDQGVEHQGAGWVYLSADGKIGTLPNQSYRKSAKIVLPIDIWEHAYFLDYGPDRRKYLENIWRIVDWTIVNDRIATIGES